MTSVKDNSLSIEKRIAEAKKLIKATPGTWSLSTLTQYLKENHPYEVDNISNHIRDNLYGAYIKTDLLACQIYYTESNEYGTSLHIPGSYLIRHKNLERLINPELDNHKVLQHLLEKKPVKASIFRNRVNLDHTDEENVLKLTRHLYLPRPGYDHYYDIEQQHLCFIQDEVKCGLTTSKIKNNIKSRPGFVIELLNTLDEIADQFNSKNKVPTRKKAVEQILLHLAKNVQGFTINPIPGTSDQLLNFCIKLTMGLKASILFRGLSKTTFRKNNIPNLTCHFSSNKEIETWDKIYSQYHLVSN